MRRKSLNILLLLLMAFCFSTCTKPGKNITIIGKVENPVTGDGISGVEIWLLKTTWGINGENKAVKTVFSDENGNFELNKLSVRAESVRIGNMHGDYYAIGWYRDGEYVTEGTTLPIKKGKKMYVDFHAVPYGKYRIKINNINCQGANDTIIINQTNYVKSFLGNDWTLTGCDGYTTSWDKVPMGTIHTKYTVIKSGVSNTYEEDFEVLPNQENEQVIDY